MNTDKFKIFYHPWPHIIFDDFLNYKECEGIIKEILNQPGRHQVLAVSPSRDFHGGDARFEEFRELFETERTARAGRLDGELLWRQFKDVQGKVHSILWASYEVNDGPV